MPTSFCCVVALLAGALLQARPAPTHRVDEIVAGALRARGGVAALKAVTSIKRTGHTTLSGSQVPVTIWTRRPNFFRRELELPGLLVILAYDGKTFWSANARDAEGYPASGRAVEQAQEEAGFDTLLLDYKAKGHKVELVATEREGDRLLHHLKIVKKNGKTEHLYLDAKTGLEARAVSTTEREGTPVELVREFSDYRPVKDIVVPFVIRDFANKTLVSETTFEAVDVNVPMDESLFRMRSKGP